MLSHLALLQQVMEKMLKRTTTGYVTSQYWPAHESPRTVFLTSEQRYSVFLPRYLQ